MLASNLSSTSGISRKV